VLKPNGVNLYQTLHTLLWIFVPDIPIIERVPYAQSITFNTEKIFIPHMRVYLDRNFLIGFGISVITLITLGIMSYFYFTRFMETARLSTHSRRVLLVTERIQALNYKLENQQFLLTIQPNAVAQPELNNLIAQLRQSQQELDSLHAYQNEQEERIRLLHTNIEQRIAYVDQWLTMMDNGQIDSTLVAGSNQLSREISERITRIQQEENQQITLRSMESSS